MRNECIHMGNELTKELEAAVKERLTSPILGTLVLSLIITNWRIVLTLLSTDSVDLKISKIEGMIYSWNILIPVGVAFGITFGILFGVNEFKNWYQGYLNRRKHVVDKEKLKLDRQLDLLDVVGQEAVDSAINATIHLQQLKTDYDDLIKYIESVKNALNKASPPKNPDFWKSFDKKIDRVSSQLSLVTKLSETFTAEYRYGQSRGKQIKPSVRRPNLPHIDSGEGLEFQ